MWKLAIFPISSFRGCVTIPILLWFRIALFKPTISISYSAFQTYDKYLVLAFQTYVKYLQQRLRGVFSQLKGFPNFCQTFAKSTKCSWRSKYQRNQSSRQFQSSLLRGLAILSFLFAEIISKRASFLSLKWVQDILVKYMLKCCI